VWPSLVIPNLQQIPNAQHAQRSLIGRATTRIFVNAVTRPRPHLS
jgi:hypothetical protein